MERQFPFQSEEDAAPFILRTLDAQLAEIATAKEFVNDYKRQEVIFWALGIVAEQLVDNAKCPHKLVEDCREVVMKDHIVRLVGNAYQEALANKHTKMRLEKMVDVKVKAVLNSAPRDLRARPTFTKELERIAGPQCPEVVRKSLKEWQNPKPNPVKESSAAAVGSDDFLGEEMCCVVCMDRPPDPKIECEQCKQKALCKPCSRLLSKIYGANKECPLCRHPGHKGKKPAIMQS